MSARARFLIALFCVFGLAAPLAAEEPDWSKLTYTKRNVLPGGELPLEAFMSPMEIYLEFVAPPPPAEGAADDDAEAEADETGAAVTDEAPEGPADLDGLEVMEDVEDLEAAPAAPAEPVLEVPGDPYARSTDLADMPFDPTEAMLARLPEHLAPYFDLILYVNKSASGPFSQEMLIFEKGADGTFHLRDRWLTSTGRERQESYFTTTLTGIFKIDHQRMFPQRYSALWGGVAMHWAMFIDFDYRTRKSGIAVHSANSKTVGQLGTRASGGCIRLSPEHAQALFKEVRDQHAGYVPKFRFDDYAGTTSRAGMVELMPDGSPMMVPGVKVLLIVDDLSAQIAVQ